MVDTVRALLNEIALGHIAGIEILVGFLPNTSLITMARNQLVGMFLESDADKMIFVDSDVSWEPGAIIQLASHNQDFVGGAYRLKETAEAYPVGWLKPDGELWAQDGLLEVEYLPGGFLCLSRAVFARLKVAYPSRSYRHMAFDGHAYFDAPFKDGRLYGEDSAFCALWRAIGGKVWLDPELTLTHHGGSPSFKGHIGNWLKSRTPDQELCNGDAA